MDDRRLGIYVPMTFECDDSAVDAIVNGTIDVDSDGNLVFTRLVFEPRPGDVGIGSRALRSISLRAILDEAIRKTAKPWDPVTGLIHIDQDTELPTPTTSEDRARLKRTKRASAVSPSQARLRNVARVYRDGGSRGMKAVQQYLSKQAGHEVSRSTAVRLVVQARDAKLLGPATPRRAGETKKRRKA